MDGETDEKRPYEDRDRERERDRDSSYHRRNRSRSRSRSRERRRYRNDRDDGYQRRWSDEEDSYPRRRRDRNDRPRRKFSEPVVFLEKIPTRVIEYDIMCQLGKDASMVRNVQINSKGDKTSAVLEFHESEDALHWFQDNKDAFYLFDEKIRMDTNVNIKRDWTCFKCGKLNFVRRSHCMTCDCSRRESETLYQDVRDGKIPDRDRPRIEDFDHGKTPPSDVLIFRGLDALSLEKDVVDAISAVHNVRMNDVRLIRDRSTNVSRGFCFVVINTVKEATELLERINSQYPSFFIQGRRVMVDYARPNYSPKDSKNSGNTIATAAIAQAQWSNVEPGKIASEDQVLEQSSIQQGCQQGGVGTVDSVQESTNNKDPDILPGYSYDANTGFYYDPKTGLYYDPKTQYHYNSQTGQYCYYDPTQLKYIPVDSQGNPVVSNDSSTTTSSTETTTESDSTEEKKKKDGTASVAASGTMDAKKIAKNMERWAKSVNAAKTAQKQQLNIIINQERAEYAVQTETQVKVGGSSVGFGGISQGGISLASALKDTEDDKPLLASHPVDEQEVTVAPTPVARGSIPRGANINPAHTDWDQLACLLCKRKFPSKDVLLKHQQFSDLHKQNLQKEKALPPKTPSPSASQLRYRDRAQERREKVGTQAIIPGWKKRIEKEIAQGPPIPYEQPTVNGLAEDNVGSKMMMAMGWTGGQGLGKSNQGITEPIKAEMRQASAGLGAPGSTYGYVSGDDYKRNMRALTKARYSETL